MADTGRYPCYSRLQPARSKPHSYCMGGAKNLANPPTSRLFNLKSEFAAGGCLADHVIERTMPRTIASRAAAIVLSILWPLTRIGDGTDPLAHILTYNLPVSLLIWAILIFAFDKASRWRFRLVAFVTILTTSVAAYWATTIYIPVSAAQRTVTVSSGPVAESPSRMEPPIVGRDTHSALVNLSTIMSQQKSRLQLDHLDYLLALRQTNLAELTSPAYIASHDDAAMTEAHLSDAKAVVAKYRDLYNARMAVARQDIATSSLPQTLKDQALRAFDSSAQSTHERTQRLWVDEMAVLDQLGLQYEFLARRRLQWRLQGTQVVFNNPADLAEFNSHLMQMRQISADELAIQNEINASASAR